MLKVQVALSGAILKYSPFTFDSSFFVNTEAFSEKVPTKPSSTLKWKDGVKSFLCKNHLAPENYSK